jgi:integrase
MAHEADRRAANWTSFIEEATRRQLWLQVGLPVTTRAVVRSGVRFVFPAGRICRDPRDGPPSRYHVHPSVVQKAVARAARLAGTTTRLSTHAMQSFVRNASS